MVRKIVWTDPAKRRLRDITEYIKKEAGTKTAGKIRDAIYARPEILAANPLAWPNEESLAKYPNGFRYLVRGQLQDSLFHDRYRSGYFNCFRMSPRSGATTGCS
jgi:plasmid stabilization system protein ParE